MRELRIKPITLQKCTGKSSKTIYNYRLLDDDKLPEEVLHKIFNFFIYHYGKKINTFQEVLEIIENMSGEEKLEMKIKFEDTCETRYASRKTGYKPGGNSTEGFREFMNHINHYNEKRERKYRRLGYKSIKDVPYDDLSKPNIVLESDTKVSFIYINPKTTKGYRLALQETLFQKLSNGNDYALLEYINNYKNQN